MPDAQPAPVGGPLPRGHLLALNRSFRRTLEAENKSPRTIEAYTDAVRLLTERGIQVDHVTIYRWVLRFAPLLAEAARPAATRSGTVGGSTRPT